MLNNQRRLAKDYIIVALDVSSADEALALVRELTGHVAIFKVGLELFTSVGPSIVRSIQDVGGAVFLDCKFMDIPNTVAGAARAAAALGVRMFNVHCLGGYDMLAAAVNACGATDKRHAVGPLVLGVTILTSIDNACLERDLNVHVGIQEQVVHVAAVADRAGLDGIIASPLEIQALRSVLSKDVLIVTPGVRPNWAAGDDQKRITTPRDAVALGADYIVVGRPITRPPKSVGSPAEAARAIAAEIEPVIRAESSC